MAITSTQKRSGSRRPATPPRRKRSPFWSRVKAFFQLTTFFTCLAIVTLIVWLVLRLEQAPRTIDLNTTPLGITYVYSSDGMKLAEFFRERRKVVSIDDMPKYLQDATVAFEDKRFYTHSGVDFRGILRALSSNISHGDLKGEGGSTITQQLARNMGIEGLDRRKSVGRKFNEWIVAHQIENSYSKSEILAMYLNQVNYGSGAYGVEAAAEVYFNKHVKQLDLAQCALLAGLPNRPTEYTPYKDMDAAKGQRKRVLEQMLDQKKITPEQFQVAVVEPIKLAGMKAPTQGTQIDHAPYFVNYVTDQIRRKYGNDRLFEGNLKIYTTLNWQMQQAAEEELVRGIHEANGYGATQGALVCLDPKTGEIKAMVGGVDYKKNQINYATHGRQPGSSFKAVVYAAAINDGSVKETTRVYDAPVTYGTWTPHDDTAYSYNHVDLRTAMAFSINVPAVRVLHLIGPQTAIRYARMMGVRPSTALDPVLSLALGSSPVSPLEMASVYSTFPAGGNHPEPSAWTRLADAQDNVIEDVPPAIETHVLQKETVTQLDDMLRAVVTEDGGTGRMVAQYIPEARGKTGTTQEHKDVWFVGYTSNLVTAVWAGHPVVKTKTQKANYGQPMKSNAFGGTVCAPIWGRFMARAQPIFQTAIAKEAAQEAKAKAKLAPVLKPAATIDTSESSSDAAAAPHSHERRRPDPPHDNGDGTVTVNVDDTSGLLAPEGATASHPETFSSGVEPSTLSPQYTNSPSDGSSTDSGPSIGSADRAPASDTQPNPRHRRHASRDTITLMINPEDGMLATKWCPQQAAQTFTRGEEPHRYSTMYSAPPGEQ